MLIQILRDAYYRLPDSLRRAILVRRRERIWLGAGIVFIHIPKAAGTSINQALYRRFMGHVRASDIERWGSARLQALPSFAVTRNPWDRLVSAYRFAKRGRGIGGEIQAGVWRPERYRIPEFETFERFVTEWLANRDVSGLDPHFQTQWQYVSDSAGRLLVDHVGRVENLEPTYSFIRDFVGDIPAIEKSNRSGKSVDYRDLYTPDLVDAVRRIYAEDIRRFGYSFGS